MRYKVIILSVLFTMLPVFLFAQNSSLEYESNLKLDIRASEFSSMNLTKNQEDIPLLVVFDYQPVEKDDLSLMDFSNPSQFSAKNLAAIVGTKPRHVKAYRILKGEDATQIWGIRGVNGVLEILSPSKYRQWTQNGYQENFNLVKGRRGDGDRLGGVLRVTDRRVARGWSCRRDGAGRAFSVRCLRA